MIPPSTICSLSPRATLASCSRHSSSHYTRFEFCKVGEAWRAGCPLGGCSIPSWTSPSSWGKISRKHFYKTERHLVWKIISKLWVFFLGLKFLPQKKGTFLIQTWTSAHTPWGWRPDTFHGLSWGCTLRHSPGSWNGLQCAVGCSTNDLVWGCDARFCIHELPFANWK